MILTRGGPPDSTQGAKPHNRRDNRKIMNNVKKITKKHFFSNLYVSCFRTFCEVIMMYLIIFRTPSATKSISEATNWRNIEIRMRTDMIHCNFQFWMFWQKIQFWRVVWGSSLKSYFNSTYFLFDVQPVGCFGDVFRSSRSMKNDQIHHKKPAECPETW